MRKSFACLSTAIASLGTFAASAQTINPDSVYLSRALGNAISNSKTENSPLFNGKLYSSSAYNPEYGHPFYASSEWQVGTITYDGVTHSHVPLLYDIVQDEVLIQPPNNPSSISLVKEKVSQFTVHNHTYVYKKAVAGSILPEGFYDLLFDGKVNALARHEKKPKSVSKSSTVLKTYFKSSDQYFISKDGAYYTVKNQSDILKLFPESKAALNQFMNEHKLSFKKEPEQALKQIAAFYSKAGN